MGLRKNIKTHLLVFGAISAALYFIHFTTLTFHKSFTIIQNNNLVQNFHIRDLINVENDDADYSNASNESALVSFEDNFNSSLGFESEAEEEEDKLDLFNITQIPLTPVRGRVTLHFDMFEKNGRSDRYRLLINNRKLCRLPDKQAPYLLIIIPSVKSHNIARDFIRQTWANVVYNGGEWGGQNVSETIKLMFLFGGSSYTSHDLDQLHKEAEEYKDIVVADFVDSYQNLSIKIGVGLHWAVQYCSGVNYTMKVDEDTFVYIPQLIKVIKMAEQKTDKFVLGRQHMRLNPPVLRGGKWKVGAEYPLPYYPRYVYGHSYVISGPALVPIMRSFRQVPTIKNEDAFFTGILAHLSGVSRYSHKSFAGTFRHEILCNVSRGHFVSVTSCCNEHLRKIYNDIKTKTCDQRLIRAFPAHRCRYTFKHT